MLRSGFRLVNSVLGHVVIGPFVQIATIKGYALLTDANFADVWAHSGVEFTLAHAEVGGCFSHSQ